MRFMRAETVLCIGRINHLFVENHLAGPEYRPSILSFSSAIRLNDSTNAAKISVILAFFLPCLTHRPAVTLALLFRQRPCDLRMAFPSLVEQTPALATLFFCRLPDQLLTSGLAAQLLCPTLAGVQPYLNVMPKISSRDPIESLYLVRYNVRST